MEHKDEYVKSIKNSTFDRTNWMSADLTYNSSYTESSMNDLHFVFLVPNNSIKLIEMFFKIDNSLSEEEVDEKFLKRHRPKSLLVEHETLIFLGEDHDVDPEVENKKLKFLNKRLDPNLEEDEHFKMVTRETFGIIKKLIPRTEDVRRVAFQYSSYSSIKVELQFSYMPILFLIDSKYRDKELTKKNLFKYLHILPVSKLMNWCALVEYFKEYACTNYDLKEFETKNSMLRYVEDGFGDDRMAQMQAAANIFRGTFPAKNVKMTRITPEMYQPGNAFLFHIRGSGTSFFKFNSKGTSNVLALEDGPATGSSNYRREYAGLSNLTSGGYSMRSQKDYYGYGSSNYYENDITDSLDPEGLNSGVVGFRNIGNTCYMNSALQCIIHIDFLRDFLLNNTFVNMINDDNPIGADGNMIKSMAALFKEYWSSHDNYIVPSPFKRCVSKYLPAFEGYSHHDSQEFLSQLLDKCHEDTNQILKKPYTEIPTLHPGLKSNEQMARDSWILHLKRNNSFFIHNFFGQFRSEIECPKCQSIYLKFDCFQVISLPIPSNRTDTQEFYFIKRDQKGHKAYKCYLSMKSYSNFNDIKVADFRKQVYSNDDLVSKNALVRVGFMSFGSDCILLYDHRSMGDVAMMADNRDDTDLFVYELTKDDLKVLRRKTSRVVRDKLAKREEVDLGEEVSKAEVLAKGNQEEYLVSRKELVFVAFSSSPDYYDEHSPIQDKITDYMTYRSKEFPIFCKAFYLSKKHRIIDLYWRIYQKFEFKAALNKKKQSSYDTSSEEEKNESFESLTTEEKFENLMKNGEMFFYIRINGRFYGEDDWYKNLSELNDEYTRENGENILKVRVFFREGERKKSVNDIKLAKVDLKYFVSCQGGRDFDFALVPENYNDQRESSYSLESLLKNSSRPEILDNENMYRCSKCKVEVKAKIKMELQKIPKVLVIFFKRIKKGYHSDSPEITYPEVIDMKPFVKDPTPIENYGVQAHEILDEKNIDLYKRKIAERKSQKIDIENNNDSNYSSNDSNKIVEEGAAKKRKGTQLSDDPMKQIYLPESQVKSDLKYELFGVVNHYGSQNFGHYTSVVKTEQGWIDFNDERASKADKSDVINKSAYMIFYRRKDE